MGMDKQAHLLIVDDNERVFKSLAMNFRRNGFPCLWAANNAQAAEAVRGHTVAAAIIDLSLGSESGLDVMKGLLELRPGLPVVFISGFGTLEAAVSAMRMGAYDFLSKPLNFKHLAEVVEKAMLAGRGGQGASRTNPDVSSAQPGRMHAPTIVTASPVLLSLMEKAARVADSDLPVLITGESGTGKELFAEHVHRLSRRRDNSFVRVNCSAVTDSLADSELFGHAKGSFTGAVDNHTGYFEQADGGSLHLDEIGDMPASVQAKILRALETGRIRSVGGATEKAIDVRVVASTNKELRELIVCGIFREDLFYRINAVHLHIPPLRERPEDIRPLLEHFLDRLSREGAAKRVADDALQMLCAYSWPGNVRELRNVIKVCALLAPGTFIRPEDLPEAIRNPEAGRPVEAERSMRTVSGRLEDSERQTIQNVLREVRGNRRLAAERLGISIRSLYYKLERHGLS